jgi:hypothetical protein
MSVAELCLPAYLLGVQPERVHSPNASVEERRTVPGGLVGHP